jgi:hypothetical protein
MIKLLYGELVIVEYVNGQFVNQWGIITNKQGVEATEGRTIKEGRIDLMIEGKEGSKIADNRYSIPSSESGIRYLKDVGFGTQPFSGKNLTILKTVNATDIFNSSGVKIGTLPGGTPIGIETGSAGNSNRHLMSVNAFQDTDGTWKFINQSTYSYGFINVQLGFGLKMYNSMRSIETAVSHTLYADKFSWSEIAQSLGYAEDESYLRDISVVATLDDVKKKVARFFSGVDLNKDDVILGDPSLFLIDDENRKFIEENAVALGFIATAGYFRDEGVYLRDLQV